MNVEPIGIIHSPFTTAEGMPIQPALAGGAEGWVEVFPQFEAGLADLEGFDRIWLLYAFHRAVPPRLRVVPFLDTTERGIFATRAPCRPNGIGMSSVRLLGVEGNILRIAEVDMLDGTPLLDIKPYAPRFDCFEVRRCGWLDQAKREPTTTDARFTDRDPAAAGDRKLRILFLCTGNSCRSQMAEGWARHLKGDVVEAYSAGVRPQSLNPLAFRVMAEAGVDLSGHRAKHVDELKGISFDYVVTVCGQAHEHCPVFPGTTRVVHVGFDDPPRLAADAKTEEEALAHYRRVRDEIRVFVERLSEVLRDSSVRH